MGAILRERAPKFHLMVGLDGKLFTAINLSLAAGAILRAWDYFAVYSSPLPNPAALTTVEQAAPLWVWSALLVGAATLIIIGSFAPPRLLLILSGHLSLCVLYAALSSGLIWQTLTDDRPGGWRVGTSVLVFALVHGAFAKAVETQRQAIRRKAERKKTHERVKQPDRR